MDGVVEEVLETSRMTDEKVGTWMVILTGNRK